MPRLNRIWNYGFKNEATIIQFVTVTCGGGCFSSLFMELYFFVTPNGPYCRRRVFVMQLLTSDSAWARFCRYASSMPHFIDELRDNADRALLAKRISVVDKQLVACADLRDYVSQGPYWWPDPLQPEGLPYVRRDGEVNPESLDSDLTRLRAFHEGFSAQLLYGLAVDSVAHFRSAGRMLKTWFLDPETRMNPHLEYAQRIPGLCEGRGIGIIDTTRLCFLLDEVVRLPFTADWTQQDLVGVRQWFSDYLDWLLESPNGKEECAELNNHGTWFDAQIVTFAYFCGRPKLATQHIEQFWAQRLRIQIERDGSQPHELKRTLSLKYCVFNLLGFAITAQVAGRLNVDLWHWQEEGTSVGILQAYRWLLPYLVGKKSWNWPQIKPFDSQAAVMLLALAYEGTQEETFLTAMEQLEVKPYERISFGHGRIA